MNEYEALQRFEQLVNQVNPIGRRMYFRQALDVLKVWVDSANTRLKEPATSTKEAPHVRPVRR